MRVWTVFDDWMERHFLLPLWDHHECKEVLVILKDFFLRQKNQVIDWLSVQKTALTNPNLV